MAAQDDGRGKWITLGGSKDDDGKRHGGSAVFVQNGRITKGAPSLTGRKIDALKDAPEESSHRKNLNREKDYTRAIWGKKAREAGHKPEHLPQLAEEMMAHDKEHVQDRKRLLRDARDLLTKYGYNAKALTTNLRSGHVEDNIPGIDLVARTMMERYPAQFASHGDRVNDDVERLTDLLTEGNPEPMDHYSAYQQALDHLRPSCKQPPNWTSPTPS